MMAPFSISPSKKAVVVQLSRHLLFSITNDEGIRTIYLLDRPDNDLSVHVGLVKIYQDDTPQEIIDRVLVGL